MMRGEVVVDLGVVDGCFWRGLPSWSKRTV